MADDTKFDEYGRPKSGYSGRVYVNSNTATDDDPRRFETDTKLLRDVVIMVKDKAQLFGDADAQTFEVDVNDTLPITLIDISTLYFRNENAGENGTVHIIGVED